MNVKGVLVKGKVPYFTDLRFQRIVVCLLDHHSVLKSETFLQSGENTKKSRVKDKGPVNNIYQGFPSVELPRQGGDGAG